MHRRKQSQTLGELIQIVSQFSHNDHEVGLAVADLLQRGVVRFRGRNRHSRRSHAGH